MDNKKIFFNYEMRNDVNLKNYNTMRIGGRADIILFPKSVYELQNIIKLIRKNKLKMIIIGKGSNFIFVDRFYDEIIINLSKLKKYSFKDGVIISESGVSLSNLANFAKENSLTGLEFAGGIPGLLGGAVVMNAGAYGNEMKDVVKKIFAIDYDGEIKEFTLEDCMFEYRNSIFKHNDLVVVSAELKSEKGIKKNIAEKMKDLNFRRKEKQPLEYPNSGSIFKRPKGNFAGALIEKSGLKGFSVGDAQVSLKHAGFIINKGNATSDDVINLIKLIQKKVKINFDINLETEVEILY